MSVGASVVQTILARRQQFHLVRLGEHLTPGSPNLALAYQAMASDAPGGSQAGGQMAGMALVYRSLLGQAASLSYLDTYIVLAVGAAAMFFLSFLLKSNDPRHTEVHAGH
jgi:DHA2 family multidrug resistance protein